MPTPPTPLTRTITNVQVVPTTQFSQEMRNLHQTAFGGVSYELWSVERRRIDRVVTTTIQFGTLADAVSYIDIVAGETGEQMSASPINESGMTEVTQTNTTYGMWEKISETLIDTIISGPTGA